MWASSGTSGSINEKAINKQFQFQSHTNTLPSGLGSVNKEQTDKRTIMNIQKC